jgi:hypothetical protein
MNSLPEDLQPLQKTLMLQVLSFSFEPSFGPYQGKEKMPSDKRIFFYLE